MRRSRNEALALIYYEIASHACKNPRESMHSGTTTLAVARENHACMIIVGGWIMIIVETQLHSGNLESSQRNLEECAPYPKQRGPVSCDMF